MWPRRSRCRVGFFRMPNTPSTKVRTFVARRQRRVATYSRCMSLRWWSGLVGSGVKSIVLFAQQGPVVQSSGGVMSESPASRAVVRGPRPCAAAYPSGHRRADPLAGVARAEAGLLAVKAQWRVNASTAAKISSSSSLASVAAPAVGPSARRAAQPAEVHEGALDVDARRAESARNRECLLDAALAQGLRPPVGLEVGIEQVSAEGGRRTGGVRGCGRRGPTTGPRRRRSPEPARNPSTKRGSDLAGGPGSGTRTIVCWWKPKPTSLRPSLPVL